MIRTARPDSADCPIRAATTDSPPTPILSSMDSCPGQVWTAPPVPTDSPTTHRVGQSGTHPPAVQYVGSVDDQSRGAG
jgi:hypothetical protein